MKMTKLTKTSFKKALEICNGTRSSIARTHNLTNGAVTTFLKKHPDMAELLEKRRLEMIDKAENELFEQIDFHDSDKPENSANIRQKAAIQVLTKLGRDKGWADRVDQTIEHKGEGFKLIIESPKDGIEKRSN